MTPSTTHRRPTWDEYGMMLAWTASLRSPDPHRQVGAAALRKDNSVAGTGYNGTPPGVEIDWSDRDLRRKYVVHAEVNCLRYCRPEEVATIYTTLSPCQDCIKTIGAFGIKRVCYSELYLRDQSCFDIASTYGMTLDFVRFQSEDLKYFNKCG
jgi:dCMP deaminase